MKDEAKTKKDLIKELVELRHRISDFEKSEVELNGMKGIQWNVRDVTERKKAEVEYKSIINTAMDGFWIADIEGNFLDVNDAYCHLIGYNREELLNMSIHGVEAAEAQEDTIQHIRHIMEFGHDRFETRHRRKDGRIVDIEVSVNYIDIGGGKLFVFLRDITDRKRTEKLLCDSEEKYRSLASTADSMYLIDRDCRYLFMNERQVERLGLPRDEVINRAYSEFHSEKDTRIFAEKIKEIFKTNTSVQYEHKSERDGRYFLRTLSPVKNHEKEETLAVTVVSKDITDRKYAEEALREGEQKLYSVIYGSPIPTFVIGKDHKVIYWNKALEELSGIKAEEVIGTSQHWRAFYSAERPCMADLLVDEALGKLPQWYSGKYIKSKLLEEAYETTDFFPELGQGGRWLRFTAAPMRDSMANLIGAIETLEDITERKRSEEALIESENKYRQLVEESSDIIYTIDLGGYFIYVNPVAEHIIGFPLSELVGRHYLSLVRPDFHEEIDAFYKKQFFENIPNTYYELPIIIQDGSTKWVGQNVQLLSVNEKVIGFHAVARDITDRKQMEEAVLQSKEDWERTFYAVPDLIAILDTEYRIVRANRAMASRLDVTPGECVGLTCYGAVHGMTAPPEFCPHRQLLEDGREHTVEVHEDRLSGDFIVSVSPLRDPEGKLIGSIHVARDITEHKQAEEVVKESENKFRVLAEKAMVGVYLIQDGVFKYVNPKGADILGYTVDELVMKAPKDFVVPEDWLVVTDNLNKRLSGEVDSIHYELRMVKKSGEVIFVEAFGSQIMYNGHPAIMGTLVDISDRKRAEEEQRHREKLQGILEMAGAICHEMNQPMQIISGYAELLMNDLSENDAIYEKLSRIVTQIDRMATITGKLMKIKDYETQDYAGFSRIIDINKSSGEDTE